MPAIASRIDPEVHATRRGLDEYLAEDGTDGTRRAREVASIRRVE